MHLRTRSNATITDQIDTVLARHYGLTEEELDFFINYDIKYRMGRFNDDDEDGVYPDRVRQPCLPTPFVGQAWCRSASDHLHARQPRRA